MKLKNMKLKINQIQLFSSTVYDIADENKKSYFQSELFEVAEAALKDWEDYVQKGNNLNVELLFKPEAYFKRWKKIYKEEKNININEISEKISKLKGIPDKNDFIPIDRETHPTRKSNYVLENGDLDLRPISGHTMEEMKAIASDRIRDEMNAEFKKIVEKIDNEKDVPNRDNFDLLKQLKDFREKYQDKWLYSKNIEVVADENIPPGSLVFLNENGKAQLVKTKEEMNEEYKNLEEFLKTHGKENVF